MVKNAVFVERMTVNLIVEGGMQLATSNTGIHGQLAV
jgi:hypothetical protein